MRISTATIYEQAVAAMNRQQADFLAVGQQMASGRSVVNPSDNPHASARAVEISQRIGVVEQHGASRSGARNTLIQEEQILDRVGDAVSRAKTLMIQGINGSLGDTDRLSVATELEGIFESVLGHANAVDGNGRFLFGGFQDGSEPFVRDAFGVVNYVGDTNERQQRIDTARLMSVSDTGDKVFNRVGPVSGYVTEAAPTNTGSVRFDGPLIIDPSDPLFGTNFQIDFVDIAGDMHYTVNGGPPTLYEDGAVINFGGLSMQLDGTPANGDGITVGQADSMNTDLFITLQKAIDVLKTPINSDVDQAKFVNQINTVMRELDNSFGNLLTLRSSVGARMNELDVIDSVAENRLLAYETNLSALIDLDYNQAVTDYSLRQVGLQAAQKTFVDMNQMSLFNFLR